jgi:signal peptidase II
MERSLKKYLQDYAFLFGIALTIVALDQWTKVLVRSHLAFQEMWSPWPWLAPYARIVHWHNTGAAFGMLQGFGDIFSILAVIVGLVIIYYFPQVPRTDWPLRLAMGLQLGGATGNLIDRVIQGHVTDFISIGNFAVFNVADASISTGVAILILGMWIKERREGRPAPGSETEADESENHPDPPAENHSAFQVTNPRPEEAQGE